MSGDFQTGPRRGYWLPVPPAAFRQLEEEMAAFHVRMTCRNLDAAFAACILGPRRPRWVRVAAGGLAAAVVGYRVVQALRGARR